jgi:hypothetical protein
MYEYDRNRAAMKYLSKQIPRLSERSLTSIKKIGLNLEVGMLTFASGSPAGLIFLWETIRLAINLGKMSDRREAIVSDMVEAGTPRARVKHLLELDREEIFK